TVSAVRRCTVLTSGDSPRSTVTPPRTICAMSRPTSATASRRSAGAVARRQVRKAVATSSTEKSGTARRWRNSIQISVPPGGITRPWHRGQSGQPSPEPVELTILPSVITSARAPTASQARRRGSLAATARLGGSHRDVVAARRLPAEEHHRQRDEEDEAAGDPHDESTQMLIGARGERLPDPG